VTLPEILAMMPTLAPPVGVLLEVRARCVVVPLTMRRRDR
jgi:hypothetical protein